MKNTSAVILFAAMLASLVSCKTGGKALLPNVSGKAGEVAVVIDKENWEGSLGTEVKGLLARDCDCLLYTYPSPRDLSKSRKPYSALKK